MPEDTHIDQGETLATLRRELASRTAERDEALAREAAMAEVLQVINSSPGDLAPVFDAMLEKATRLCDAAFGWFWTYEADQFQVRALHGAPPALVEFLRQPVQGFHAGTGVGRLVRARTCDDPRRYGGGRALRGRRSSASRTC